MPRPSTDPHKQLAALDEQLAAARQAHQDAQDAIKAALLDGQDTQPARDRLAQADFAIANVWPATPTEKDLMRVICNLHDYARGAEDDCAQAERARDQAEAEAVELRNAAREAVMEAEDWERKATAAMARAEAAEQTARQAEKEVRRLKAMLAALEDTDDDG